MTKCILASTSKSLAQMYYNSAVASKMARLLCISSLVPYSTWLHCWKLLRRNLPIQLPSSCLTAPTLSIALRGSNFQQYYSTVAQNTCALPLLHQHRQILNLNQTGGTFCGNSSLPTTAVMAFSNSFTAGPSLTSTVNQVYSREIRLAAPYLLWPSTPSSWT